jgi:hypothetical protein
VKAGISHLADYTRTWLQAVIKASNEKKKSAPAEPKIQIIVGLKVTRKECKREGEVTAIDGEKLTITLADGDVRRPNVKRFNRLYTC